jgi:hypothetical protein
VTEPSLSADGLKPVLLFRGQDLKDHPVIIVHFTLHQASQIADFLFQNNNPVLIGSEKA